MKSIIDICNVNTSNSLHSLYEASLLDNVISEASLLDIENTLSLDNPFTAKLWNDLCVNPNKNNNGEKALKTIEAIITSEGKVYVKKPNKWGQIAPSGRKPLIQMSYSKSIQGNDVKKIIDAIVVYDNKHKRLIYVSQYKPFINKTLEQVCFDRLLFDKPNNLTSDVYEVPEVLLPFVQKIFEFTDTLK